MSHTILVADDSVTIQRAIQIAFEKEPYRVVRAMNGDDALTQARSASPSIILVDHAMPGKTGYEVAEMLKGDPSLSQIPVLFMSGPSAPFDEARAQGAGIVGHIAKPFDCQTLVEKVGAVLGVAPTVPGASPLQPATSAAPVSAAASHLPRPPGAPAPAAPAPQAAPQPAPQPASVATPAARDPFGFGGAPAAATSVAASASDEEEDISFGFDEPKKPAAPAPKPAAPVAAAVAPAVAAAAAPIVAAAVPANGASKEAITAATREIIEQVVWEVVPELAETIIREEIARLLRERTAR